MIRSKIHKTHKICRDKTQPQYAQLAFTCSKSTMETPEQCVKSVQS